MEAGEVEWEVADRPLRAEERLGSCETRVGRSADDDLAISKATLKLA